MSEDVERTRGPERKGSRSSLPAAGLIAFGALALTGLAAAAQTGGGDPAPTSAEAPSFVGMFFVSRSAGPDGVLRTEWFGTILIWVLLLCSVAGIGLAINLIVANSRRAILPEGQDGRMRKLLARNAWQEAMILHRKEPSDFATMMQASLEEAPQGHDAMVDRVGEIAGELITERFRRIEPLNVLGQVAPMIGLFGTVYGMIVAFQSIVASGGNADPVALAGGIGTALVTTFWGLLVAIPALAAYAFIRNRVDALSSEAEALAIDLLKRFRAGSGSDDEATSGEPA